jgi:hypothetical protein
MSATEESSGDFDSMTYDSAAAVLTRWSHCLNCTLETVEYVPGASSGQLEALVVFISTNFTLSH